MTYRIIETTDDQNLGQTFVSVSVGDVLTMRSGSVFKVQHIAIDGDMVTLSNPNYVVIATKE